MYACFPSENQVKMEKKNSGKRRRREKTRRNILVSINPYECQWLCAWVCVSQFEFVCIGWVSLQNVYKWEIQSGSTDKQKCFARTTKKHRQLYYKMWIAIAGATTTAKAAAAAAAAAAVIAQDFNKSIRVTVIAKMHTIHSIHEYINDLPNLFSLVVMFVTLLLLLHGMEIKWKCVAEAFIESY